MSDPEPKKPSSPAEQWRAVMLTGLGEEARELEEASDEMIDEELRLQGINPDRLGKDGEALARRLLREAEGVPPEPEAEASAPAAPAAEVVSGPSAAAEASSPDVASERSRALEQDPVTAEATVYQLPPRPRPRWPLLLIAAAVAAAAVGTGVVVAKNGGPPPKTPNDLPDPNPVRPERPTQEVAAALRNDAERDCRDGRWEECQNKLDNAQALDPQGDKSETVQRMRVGIAKALTPVTASPEAGAKGAKAPH